MNCSVFHFSNKRCYLFLVLLIFSYSISFDSKAQTDPKVYSVFLYGFAKAIKWPEQKSSGDFLIGVMDSPILAEELRRMALQRSIGSQKITVKEFSSADGIEDCHILFLSSTKSQTLISVINKLPTSPMLIISEGEGLAQKGSCLNFVKVDGKLRFEINSSSIEARGIKVPGNLKSMGIVVN